MTLIWNIIQSVITILEIRVCVWMMEKFAEPRYSGKKQKIVVWIVTLGVGGLYSLHRWTTSYYSRTVIITILALLFLMTFWLFIYHRIIAIFVMINYLMVGGLIDLIFMSAVEIIMQEPGIFLHIDHINDGYRIIVIMLSKALLFVSCWILYKKINNMVVYQLIDRRIQIIYLVPCIAEYIGIHMLNTILDANMGITQDFWHRSIFCLIVILLMIALAWLMILYYDKKGQLKMKNIYLNSLDYQNQRILRLYRERETLYHDFKNHLLALNSFMQLGDLKQYQSYMERICEPFLQKPVEWRTGHSVMDLILNYKIWEAKKQKIQVKCKIYGYFDFHAEITDEEACSLMGNLWDNAIEACDRLGTEEKWIEFQMNIRQEKLLIEISNPCQGILQDEKGHLRTIKTEKGIHGVGMRTIRDITERHHGYFNYVLYGHVFKVEIMICNNKKQEGLL